ncbi:MAG: SDR family oxidoreductase [Ectothiorhodospiraceae bacterium]|jgi:NAD(P)-dependent dehydrogenase (short-subunit alcohol dehydrogenase family)
MGYFVTGATGFIGRRLVERLLRREGDIYVLVRQGSEARFQELRERNGDTQRLIPVTGDLMSPALGLDAEDVSALRGRIEHFFHLGAVYDLRANPDVQLHASIDGTRNAVTCAEQLQAGHFHLMSSIAAAGLTPGIFREDMFDEAEELDHPYLRGKHEAERAVRQHCSVPWRIYRPGFVVGDSRTGEMDKIDGPYYLFKPIQKLRDNLPRWAPVLGVEGGHFNIVPVDYVTDALDCIAHAAGEDGNTFHLVDPKPHRFGDVVDIFAEAAHAPRPAARINARIVNILPPAAVNLLGGFTPLKQLLDEMLDEFGMPTEAFRFINWPTRYDDRETARVLKGAGIEVPRLEDYAWRLWDYWERHLDPDLLIDRSLEGHVRGRIVVITGSSSGIGRATALRFARAGAIVILVARNEEKLMDTMAEIRDNGGTAHMYSVDLTDWDATDTFCAKVLEDHGRVDILINNAGRSIRRSVAHSYDRFHDFERTMRLNYFACLRVTLNFLPAMEAQGEGQVVNISSIGVLSNAPRFSAYVASKAALEAFSRCAASEFADEGITFTTINMPLVRTPMIAPTRIYESLPTLTPAQAAELVARAVIEKPEQLVTGLGKTAQVIHAVAPTAMQKIMNAAFRMFPESKAAMGKGEEGGEQKPTKEQLALANLMRGIHW